VMPNSDATNKTTIAGAIAFRRRVGQDRVICAATVVRRRIAAVEKR
jgi:hypothetical protein